MHQQHAGIVGGSQCHAPHLRPGQAGVVLSEAVHMAQHSMQVAPSLRRW